MLLDLLGHACVSLTDGRGTCLLIDPYESGEFDGRLRYEPIDVEPDYVVSSHAHADHAAFDAVPGTFQIVDSGRAGSFEIGRVKAFHDEYGGRRRGGSIDILKITVDEQVIVHLSDVGHSPITSVCAQLGQPDILLVPVGGFFTIGAAQAWEWIERLNPRCAIPVHQRTPACELQIRDTSGIAAWRSESIAWKSSPIVVQEELPSTLFLKHRRVGSTSAAPGPAA